MALRLLWDELCSSSDQTVGVKADKDRTKWPPANESSALKRAWDVLVADIEENAGTAKADWEQKREGAQEAANIRPVRNPESPKRTAPRFQKILSHIQNASDKQIRKRNKCCPECILKTLIK